MGLLVRLIQVGIKQTTLQIIINVLCFVDNAELGK